MSLVEAFSEVGPRANHAQICKYVREEFIGTGDIRNPHYQRRRVVEQRVRFYEDDYEEDVIALIRNTFEDRKAQNQRIRLKALALAGNVTRRIIDEYSAAYDKPAKRTLASDRDQEVFDEVARMVSLHETNKDAHRLTNLCNEVLKWFGFSPVDGTPQLRVITADAFDVVPDPRDELKVGAILLDAAPVSLLSGPDRSQLPHYQLWDDEVLYVLNADGYQIGRPRKHGHGRIPGYLQHKRKPRKALLSSKLGQDIISAHMCVVLLEIMTLRLAKAQGENQPVLSGNLARMAKGQSFDGETPLALPPGVAASMLNSRTDPDHYLKQIRHHIATVAHTYGMSYEQFTFSESADTASGKAYSVRREKLTEIRDEQVERAGIDEREVAELMADMLRSFGLSSFDAHGLHTDFPDPRLPQDAGEELDVLEKGIKLSVDSPIRFVMRKYGYSRKEAQEYVTDCIQIRARIMTAMRALNLPGEVGEPGRSPQENGALPPVEGEETEETEQ